MRHEDDGAFQLGLQIEKLILQPGADQGVEGGKGFVHQEDRRVGDKGAGEADALLHAARKLAHLAVGPLRQVHEGQLFVHLGAALVGGLSCQFKAKADIVAHRAPRQQAELLEHHGDGGQAQAAQGVLVGLGDRDHFGAVPHPHLAAHDGVEGIDAAQKGGFARAGKAHQHQNLALADGQRAVVDAEDLAGLGLDVAAA